MKSLNTNTLAKPTLPPIAQFSGADRDAFLEQLKEDFSTQEYMTENGKTEIFRTSSVHDKFHRTLILSGFCLLKIAKISL
ncbi:hypothetical protein ACWQFH_10365, partial [Acinetobacter baumannii]